MNCRQTRRLLSAQREWTQEEQAAVREHLAACPACQAVAREYELMDRRLGRLPEPSPAVALWPAVRARTVAAQGLRGHSPASRPRQVLQGAALIAAVALIAMVAWGWWANPSPAPPPTRLVVASPADGKWSAGVSPAPPSPTPPPTSPAVTATPSIIYGVQAQALGQDPAPIVKAVHELGFGWVKQQVHWAEIEPQPGEFHWDELDRAVDGLHDAGLHLLLNVVDAPRWTWPEGAAYEVMGPPADPADFAAFMGTLAARYRGRIGAYEIWQEQNIGYAWGGEVDAQAYLALLQAAFQAVKAADPDALVISGGLAPTGAPPPMDDARYLAEMYRLGLKSYADAVGVHLPAYNLPPDADWQTYRDPSARFRGFEQFRHRSWSFRDTAEAYRRVMEEHDAAAQPLWVTEFGWAVSDDPPQYWEYAGDNTPQEQADFTLRALDMAEEWGWVEAMFLWNLNLAVVSPDSPQAMWGIVGPDWERTETFEALSRRLAETPGRAKAEQFTWPMAGMLTRSYTHAHPGIEIANRRGTPVYAAAAGRVILAGTGTRQDGREIALDHGNGWVTRYTHLDTILVQAGEQVQKGQKIGTVGVGGQATGPALYFEVRRDDLTVDPLAYLP